MEEGTETSKPQEWFGKEMDIEDVLNEMDRRGGTVKEKYSPWSSPAEALYDRILVGLSEGVGHFKDDQQHDDFSAISWAFSVIAIDHFSKAQQGTVVERYQREKEIFFPDSLGYMKLTPHQAAILSRIVAKVDIDFDPQQTKIDFGVLEKIVTPRTIQNDYEYSDSAVEETLSTARQSEDGMGNLLSNIEDLDLRQQVILLLKLSKDEFNEFRRRLGDENETFARLVIQVPGFADDDSLRDTFGHRLTPTYLLEAERRRHQFMFDGFYPEIWDVGLENES